MYTNFRERNVGGPYIIYKNPAELQYCKANNLKDRQLRQREVNGSVCKVLRNEDFGCFRYSAIVTARPVEINSSFLGKSGIKFNKTQG